jgi:rhodanese-related sulfurtransferase
MKMPYFWWLPVGKVPEISPQELERWLADGRPMQLADARTRMEFEQGSIGGARHAPVTEMPASIERLNLESSLPVVILCLSGHRSRPGTRWLRARGIQAYSLQKGVSTWVKAGLPLNKPGSI